MGSILSCVSTTNSDPRHRRRQPPFRRQHPNNSNIGSSTRYRSSTNKKDDILINDQALVAAAALLIHQQQQQQQNGGGVEAFDRSSSLRYANGRKKEKLVRCESSRARGLSDPVLDPKLLVTHEEELGPLETKHFVLVHGGGFGAWCWYKTIALLEDNGFKVNAIDLTGSGIHSFDSNNITSLTQYVKPLASFLENLGDEDKVILVGHDFGGACISHAMETFPLKVSKAVFISAAMLTNGQSTLDVFSQQDGTNELRRQAQNFLYANGSDKPPTAINLDKLLLKDLLFNQSPVKDVALASVSMRPIPFAPVLEKLSLTENNYGSVRRFFVETTEDNAIPLSLQQKICDSNPPEKIFRIKSSDHSPFFSKPQALHKFLVEIAKIPPIQAQENANN